MIVAFAEIISIGNELLQGDVLDTNTHWLCRQISGMGGRVRRAAMVPDDPQAIAEALGSALQRHPDLLLLTGGLGPTSDDRTLASLAEALGRPLELNEQALAMVRATYEQLADGGLVQDATLTEVRRKMAHLPQGAEAVYNPVGAAPGVLLRLGDTVCVSLPGVPGELKSIFGESLRGLWTDLFGKGTFVERVLITDCGDESRLAPVVDGVAAGHPEVYVKSRAQLYGEGVLLRITLSLSGDDPMAIRSALDAADSDLTTGLAAVGIHVLEREDDR
jgi:molybdenum cofactor synthesis domain-containing protein